MKISKLASQQECTGCLACFNVCPANAIELFTDEEGFVRPTINPKNCIGCMLCSKACYPLQHNHEIRIDPSMKQEVLAGWSKNKHVRRTSTSGGAFFELAKSVLLVGGVVYGAALDDKNIVSHQRIDNVNLLYRLQGSKYVQSYIGKIYTTVKNDLNQGKFVLFSGTPCQVKALLCSLHSTQTDKLLTIDLLCHGVPSPMVYRDYLKYLESTFRDKISNQGVFFRDKKYSWSEYNMRIKFNSGSEYISMSHADPYLRGFLRNYFLRPSCHHCSFANVQRPGDITLGDYWGFVGSGIKDYDDDKGISMIIINTQKALHFIKNIKGLKMFKREMESVSNTTINFKGPFKPNINRQSFWEDYGKKGFEFVVNKYLYPEDISIWAKKRMRRSSTTVKMAFVARKLVSTVKRKIFKYNKK